MKKILILTAEQNLTSLSGFRLAGFADVDFLEQGSVFIRTLPESSFKRMAFFLSLPSVDICIIYREILSAKELFCLKLKSGKLVYDFDCAVWGPDNPFPSDRKELIRHDREKSFAMQCSKVNLCIAGTVQQARHASQFSENVHVVPTGIDPHHYLPLSDRDESRPLQVGWVGPAHEMEYLRSVFERLHVLGGPIQFQVISSAPYEGPCQEYVIWEKYNEDRKASQLQGIDIALFPLGQDDYSQGLCGVRLLQCMSCGIPVIASAVGPCVEIVDHGIDGFLIHDASEWEKYVMYLLDNLTLRENMGRAAREKVSSRYVDHLMMEEYRYLLGL